MLSFIGDYTCKLDSKGRGVVPAVFRKEMQAAGEVSFVMRRNIFDECIDVYPKDEWLKLIAGLREKLSQFNREQVRSKNKETLQAIIDNDSLDESKKKDAVNEMITLTDIAEKESNAEMMLEAKGFTDVVVSMNDDGCDVVLNMGEATDAKRAQVEDIVKRKTGVSADKIVITPIQ